MEMRDRIAAVLYRTYPPYQLGYTFGCPTEKWEDESERCRDVYLRDADAVIAEMDLRHESRFGIDEPGAGYTSFSRYVTDWTVDE
jgi:hypothetical protein